MRSFDPATELVCFCLCWLSCRAVNITLISIHMTDYGRDGFLANDPIYDVVLEMIQESNPDIFENFTHLAVRYNQDKLNTSRAYFSNQRPMPCNAITPSVSDFFWNFYYRNSNLFNISANQMTVLTSPDCNEASTELSISVGEPSVPIFLSVPSTRLMDNKRFPTVLNMFGMPDANFAATIITLAQVYSWKEITAVCDDVARTFQSKMCKEFQPTLYDLKSALRVEKVSLRASERDVPVYDKILEKVSSNRVCFALLAPPTLRQFMIAAYQRNMVNGDFVYFTIAVRGGSSDELYWKANDQYDQDAFLAFQALLLITDSTPDRTKFANYSNRLDQKYFERYNWSLDTLDRDTGHPTFVFELLSVFSDTFTRVWTSLENMTAISFVQQCLNRTYNLLTRPLYIDPNGKVLVPVPVYRLCATSLTFNVVMWVDLQTGKVSNESFFTWFDYGSLPADFACGFRDGCLFDRRPDLLIIIPVLTTSLCIALIITGILIRRAKMRKHFEHLFINRDAVTFTRPAPLFVSCGSRKEPLHGLIVQYNEKGVFAKRIESSSISRHGLLRNNKFCTLALLMSHINHKYLATFHGLTLDKLDCYLLYEKSERGTLKSMLSYDQIFQDVELRLFFVDNLIQGLLFIHRTQLLFHGTLSSSLCLLSSRYSLRIAQAGFLRLSDAVAADNRQKISTDPASVKKWQKLDILDLGLILIEMFATDLQETNDGTAKITFNPNVPAVLQDFIYACLSRSSDAVSTKGLQIISKRIRRRNRDGIVQLLLSKLEEHAEKLEETVYQRTLALNEETLKVDNLLRMMLPEPIIQQLRNHQTVSAELFSLASVMFSDIPVFLLIVEQCTPLEVVSFLDNIHSKFDETVAQFDAYKVETINDSYVIVSGVPTRNGDTHSATLCALALQLLVKAKSAKVSSVQDISISVRIGINSGSVAAGVVGTRMPRYCLFGDTMNTASRMESSGEADKVHVSRFTQLLASADRRFHFTFDQRGLINIKGKGAMETYWLIS